MNLSMYESFAYGGREIPLKLGNRYHHPQLSPAICHSTDCFRYLPLLQSFCGSSVQARWCNPNERVKSSLCSIHTTAEAPHHLSTHRRGATFSDEHQEQPNWRSRKWSQEHTFCKFIPLATESTLSLKKLLYQEISRADWNDSRISSTEKSYAFIHCAEMKNDLPIFILRSWSVAV